MKILLLLFIFFPYSAHSINGGQSFTDKTEIVRLDFDNGNMCTGTFINKSTILTAAHCLMNQVRLKSIVTTDDQIISFKNPKNILHPEFDHSFWPSRDVGLIKVSEVNMGSHLNFSNVQLPLTASVKIYGCGVIQIEPKMRGRHWGENSYFRIGAVLFFLGKPGIASNDSGRPILDTESGKIIAISTQASNVLSVATSIVDESNFDFIEKNKN